MKAKDIMNVQVDEEYFMAIQTRKTMKKDKRRKKKK
jgi:hypothetical protein